MLVAVRELFSVGLVVLCAVVGALVFVSAPALAAAPEAPETESVTVSTATAAVVHGVLDPMVASTELVVEYGFFYAPRGAGCMEGYFAPEVPGVAPGKLGESVGQDLTGLEPSTEYAVCLAARSLGEEGWTVGSSVSFKTLAAAPAVESEGASGVSSTSARLEAQVNANNQSTIYKFEYSNSATGETLNAPVTSLVGAGPLEGFGSQVAGVVTGAVLAPGTTYFYRVLAENAAHEKQEGEVASFTTVATPSTSQVSEITATTATFNGSLTPLNPGVAGEYSFVYKVGTECTGESGTPTMSAGTGSGSRTVEEPAVTGLLPNTRYAVCMVASNAFGSEQAPPVTFTTLIAAPKIESESSTVIDATEARLEAGINPGNSETAYRFEYGLSVGSYEVSVPGVDGHVSAGLAVKSVSAVATGLKPGTTYHYRVVASNALPGGVDGLDGEFRTPAAAPSAGFPGSCPNEQRRAEQPFGLTLPDCRAYEMVSPVETGGQDATDSFIDVNARASVCGRECEEREGPAITYASRGSFGNPAGAAATDQLVSLRNVAEGGWETQAVTPLWNPEGTINHSSFESMLFTPDLTAGIATTDARLGEAPLLGEHFGVYLAQFAAHTYRYVGPSAEVQEPWGASTGLERVVLSSLSDRSLIEEVGGVEVPVSVTNTGKELAASAGSAEYASSPQEKDAWQSTSENGSRVYFTMPFEQESEIGQLYVRVNIDQPHIGKEQSELNPKGECTEPVKACTIEVSASRREPEDPEGPKSARYWGASANGEKVFFTSDAELTEDAYTGPNDNAANLYEYDLETHELTDLTVDSADVAEGAAVQGVVQISEKGSYVYFVATGALKGKYGEALRNASGAEPATGEDNLYVSHGGGPPVFIVTLAAKDQTDWLNVAARKGAGPQTSTALTTPNGTQLAFISEQSLPTTNFSTGYDNEQAQSDECKEVTGINGKGETETETGRCREIFVYDAEAQSLACASCNPTGARPVGPSSLPGVDTAYQSFASYRPRDLIADGTLFFDSKDALVPHASDGRQNVYEYEDGHVYAISNVAGGDESFFLDASPSGQDVFFGSANQLLKQDTGDNVVVWDARQDGGFPVAPVAPSCDNGDSCKPPPSAQPSAFAPTGSATFNGLGNLGGREPKQSTPAITTKKKTTAGLRAEKLAKALKSCRKDKKKSKRQTCEKQARAKYAPTKAKKKTKAKKSDRASNDRRATR